MLNTIIQERRRWITCLFRVVWLMTDLPPSKQSPVKRVEEIKSLSEDGSDNVSISDPSEKSELQESRPMNIFNQQSLSSYPTVAISLEGPSQSLIGPAPNLSYELGKGKSVNLQQHAVLSQTSVPNLILPSSTSLTSKDASSYFDSAIDQTSIHWLESFSINELQTADRLSHRQTENENILLASLGYLDHDACGDPSLIFNQPEATFRDPLFDSEHCTGYDMKQFGRDNHFHDIFRTNSHPDLPQGFSSPNTQVYGTTEPFFESTISAVETGKSLEEEMMLPVLSSKDVCSEGYKYQDLDGWASLDEYSSIILNKRHKEPPDAPSSYNRVSNDEMTNSKKIKISPQTQIQGEHFPDEMITNPRFENVILSQELQREKYHCMSTDLPGSHLFEIENESMADPMRKMNYNFQPMTMNDQGDQIFDTSKKEDNGKTMCISGESSLAPTIQESDQYLDSSDVLNRNSEWGIHENFLPSEDQSSKEGEKRTAVMVLRNKKPQSFKLTLPMFQGGINISNENILSKTISNLQENTICEGMNDIKYFGNDNLDFIKYEYKETQGTKLKTKESNYDRSLEWLLENIKLHLPVEHNSPIGGIWVKENKAKHFLTRYFSIDFGQCFFHPFSTIQKRQLHIFKHLHYVSQRQFEKLKISFGLSRLYNTVCQEYRCKSLCVIPFLNPFIPIPHHHFHKIEISTISALGMTRMICSIFRNSDTLLNVRKEQLDMFKFFIKFWNCLDEINKLDISNKPLAGGDEDLKPTSTIIKNSNYIQMQLNKRTLSSYDPRIAMHLVAIWLEIKRPNLYRTFGTRTGIGTGISAFLNQLLLYSSDTSHVEESEENQINHG